MEGIVNIYAEIAIFSLDEGTARSIASSQAVPVSRCKWAKNQEGHGGRLYLSGPLFFDEARNTFTFMRPK